MSAPTYVTYFILLSSIGIIAAGLVGLRDAVSHTDWEPSRRTATFRTASIVLLLWFIAAAVLSYVGAFRGTPQSAPTLQFGLLVPLIVGLIWLWRSAAARRH